MRHLLPATSQPLPNSQPHLLPKQKNIFEKSWKPTTSASEIRQLLYFLSDVGRSILKYFTMVKRGRGTVGESQIIDLQVLQDRIRRQPESHKDEFLGQYQHYQSLKEILNLNPSGFGETEQFMKQINLIAHVCVVYPSETKDFADDLGEMLVNHHTAIAVELREKMVQSLVQLTNRQVITEERLIQILFPLLPTTNSKVFRKDIYTTLVRLLKNANKNTRAPKLNKSVQTLLFTLLESSDGPAAAPDGLWAAKLTRELWRRSIWDDARSVEIMKIAALHGNTKVSIAGVNFFLGEDRDREKALRKKRGLDSDDSSDGMSSDDEDGAVPNVGEIKHKVGVNKKTGKRARKLENAVKVLKKKEETKGLEAHLNFSAIHLLHDPQGFAERLFSQTLSRSSGNKYTLEQRIQILNLVSRLIGVHKLSVLGVYSYLLKYLTPKQRDVTQFMACAAQASHDLVPPDALSPVIRKIADEFVSDGVAPEVAAAGINTIREILTRNPLAIDQDLLQDLTQYHKSKAKSVMMAARSLIRLYRDVAPEMLARKDLDKISAMEMSANARAGIENKKLQYGVENVVEGIPGLELLEQWRKEQGLDVAEPGEDGKIVSKDDGDDAAWNVKDADDEEEGWINVESDKEYEVSDAEGDDDKDSDDEAQDDDDDDVDSDVEENAQVKERATEEPEAKRAKLDPMQSLMATRILTPADFQKLEELRQKAGIDKILHGSKSSTMTRHQDTVDANSLIGTRSTRADKDERMDTVMEGRKDREFGSKKGKKLDSKPHSTTNKEKARKKNFIMMIHTRDIQGKNRKSLRDKQKSLKANIEKQKKYNVKH
ncbi:SDA1-domain-containing protein [Myxozyma melibiosi]|uniref:Protein SDA1 n=1 Tax=Myxozyma melibiosi TaxID=54550 RepID=A0ABR1EZF5_9ASCO